MAKQVTVKGNLEWITRHGDVPTLGVRLGFWKTNVQF